MPSGELSDVPFDGVPTGEVANKSLLSIEMRVFESLFMFSMAFWQGGVLATGRL